MKTKFRFLFLVLAGILFLFYCSLKISNKKQNSDESNFRLIKIPIYNQEKDFVLIKIINRFNDSNKKSKAHNRNKDDTIIDLFKILELKNLILIDTEILSRLQTLTVKLTGTASIAFGVVLKDLSEIKSLDEDLATLVGQSKCVYFKNEGYYKEIKILTSLHLKCDDQAIQISIIYKRGSFLWIGRDIGIVKSSVKAQFGDVPRAINRFKTTRVAIDSLKFRVPKNIDQFLFDYKHSTFLECSEELARKNLKPNYLQNKMKNNLVQKGLKYISNSLEGLHKEYWLSAGTLLGWYRDCGIIPHTLDADFMVRADDFDVKIIDKFNGNKRMPLRCIIGTRNDSLELRLSTRSFTFDLFFAYKSKTKHRAGPPLQWSGYQSGKNKYRMMVPYFNEVCSAELLNHKYLVPCDPESYLDKNYGPSRWKTPEADFKKYVWPSIEYHGKWTDRQLIDSARIFDDDGGINQMLTFRYVNKSLDKPISEIYFFKNLLFD